MVFCGLKLMFTFVSLSEFILHGRGSWPLWLFKSVRLSLTCAMSSFSGSAGCVVFLIKLYLLTCCLLSHNFLKLTEIISRIRAFGMYFQNTKPPAHHQIVWYRSGCRSTALKLALLHSSFLCSFPGFLPQF